MFAVQCHKVKSPSQAKMGQICLQLIRKPWGSWAVTRTDFMCSSYVGHFTSPLCNLGVKENQQECEESVASCTVNEALRSLIQKSGVAGQRPWNCGRLTVSLEEGKIFLFLTISWFLRWMLTKSYVCNGSPIKKWKGASLVAQVPWRREWLPTPGFLAGKSHGQRSLTGYTAHGVTTSQTYMRRENIKQLSKKKVDNWWVKAWTLREFPQLTLWGWHIPTTKEEHHKGKFAIWCHSTMQKS